MRNTEHISEPTNITFNGKIYSIRTVNIKGFGDENIATESLQNVLLVNDSYVSDEARQIDESIFFFVEDKYINLDDKKLAEYVEKNVSQRN